MNNLISVKVMLEGNESYSTSVNGNSSDKDLNEYFVGTVFNMGSGENDRMVKCIGISIDRGNQ